jgi:hypothetical protein
VPIATRAHVSHDTLAPCDSRRCGCDRHDCYEEDASAALL